MSELVTQTCADLLFLERAMEWTAERMRRSFKTLGSLNGARNAPMPERNTVVHLASTLAEGGFGIYAEPSFSSPCGASEDAAARSGRIDLLASNGEHTYIFEVKTFGKRRFDAVLRDAERLAHYTPQADARRDKINEEAFWTNSTVWGCVVVQSFSTEEIVDLWADQISQPDAFERRLAGPLQELRADEAPGLRALATFLTEREAVAGRTAVCEDIWECKPLWLLWAAFRVKAATPG